MVAASLPFGIDASAREEDGGGGGGMRGIDGEALAVAAAREHRDSHVVECDVERSLWAFTMGWSDERRDAKRGELRRVINGSVCAHDAALPAGAFYSHNHNYAP